MSQFTIIVDNDEFGSLRCSCGCQFDYNVHTEDNLFWDAVNKTLVPACPGCFAGMPKCLCGNLSLGNHDGLCKACSDVEYQKTMSSALSEARSREYDKELLALLDGKEYIKA